MIRSPNRVVAALVAGILVAAGVGALLTARPWLALVFGVAAVALGLAALLGMRSARVANIVAGSLWLALGIAGLFLIGTPGNVLGLVSADEVLLFAAATLQLAAGLGARRDQPTPPPAEDAAPAETPTTTEP